MLHVLAPLAIPSTPPPAQCHSTCKVSRCAHACAIGCVHPSCHGPQGAVLLTVLRSDIDNLKEWHTDGECTGRGRMSWCKRRKGHERFQSSVLRKTWG